MAVDTTTASELTREQVAAILVTPLEQQSRFLQAGPRIFDTAEMLHIPKLGAATAVTFVGENELIPEQDVGFDEVTLMPSTMKSVKVITRFSNELARQSVIALDAALKQRLVKDVADKIDAQLFSATGDGTATPKGMFAWAGCQSLPVGGAITLDVLLDAEALALAANVDPAGLRWVMQPRELSKLRKLKTTTGEYLVQPDPTGTLGYQIWGHPVILTSRCPDTGGGTPTARAALVDFSQVAVARDLAPSVVVLSERYADYDQQALRVVTRYDCAPLNPEAVVRLSTITI